MLANTASAMLGVANFPCDMALYDLPYSISVEELAQSQQQMRLQSLKQLELLRIRQARYKSTKQMIQATGQFSVGPLNGLSINSDHVKGAGDEVRRLDHSYPGEVISGASQSSSGMSNMHGERDTSQSNTYNQDPHARRLGTDYHATMNDGISNKACQSDQSARTARQKLASSSNKPSNSSSTFNDMDVVASNGNMGRAVSVSMNDGTSKLANGAKSIDTSRLVGKSLEGNGKVVVNKPPVHRVGDGKSTTGISDNNKVCNAFDASYNGIDSSMLNCNGIDRSCTPERLNQSLEGTPKSILRHRQIIDKNVHVESKFDHTPTTKRSSRNRRGLNFSYSNVDNEQVIVGKSKSVNFLVDTEVDIGTKSRHSTARPATSNRVLEQGNVEELEAGGSLYFSGKSPRPTNNTKASTKSISSASGDCASDSEAPINLLLHTGNDRKHARVVCDLDKRARSSMFSDDLSHRADESVQHSESGLLDQSQHYSKLLADRDQRGPLLGYDWIAGLMDNEQTLADIPDDCFDEVREFRRLNKDACVGRYDLLKSYEIGRPISPEVENPTHTCIHGYTVNERLFTEPVNVNEQGSSVCPVCMASRKEPSAESPGFVRVSIPQKTLEKPYRIKPHRRRSFDATDSCALSKHCLAGWECSHPSVIPTASNLDLRHSTNGLRSQMITTEQQVQSLASDFSRASRLLTGSAGQMVNNRTG